MVHTLLDSSRSRRALQEIRSTQERNQCAIWTYGQNLQDKENKKLNKFIKSIFNTFYSMNHIFIALFHVNFHKSQTTQFFGTGGKFVNKQGVKFCVRLFSYRTKSLV